MSLHINDVTRRLVALVGISLLVACDSTPPDMTLAPIPVEVGVITVNVKDVPLITELPGRTLAYRKAEVRPQVTGIIEKRLFVEGAEITAGTQLYQIDAATYEVALTRAQAELARAEANLITAKARESRFQGLASAKAISRQDYDDVLAALGQAKADVAAGKAAVETALINLRYTKVKAPIGGIIGKSDVTEGALVTSGQPEILTTIQQLDPIYVDVSQSATELLRIRRLMMDGSLITQEAKSVRLLLDDGSIYEHEGLLQFAEVEVNDSTGTVVLRAIFPNPDRLLLPGMFVRAELREGVRAKAMVVPQQGVTRDRSGNATALVVNDANEIEQRQVKISRAIDSLWLVEEGLLEGDQLVVEGLQKVRPSTLVKPVLVASLASETKE